MQTNRQTYDQPCNVAGNPVAGPVDAFVPLPGTEKRTGEAVPTGIHG